MQGKTTRLKQTGFTLMELIGAMAIIGILAAVLAPALTDAIDRAYGSAEEENVQMLVEALEQHILENKTIPNQAFANWVPAIAVFADLAEDDVRFNARGFSRRLYVDPRFFTNTDTNFGGYTQTTGLTARPVSPRIMLVSDLTGDAPAPPTTSADFNAIWDQNAGVGVVEGDQVKVQRLNLAGRFHRVLLVNSDVQQASFALEAAGAVPVPGAVGGVDGSVTRYLIENTRLSVNFSPFPSGGLNTVTIVSREVAMHYTTDGSSWFWERS